MTPLIDTTNTLMALGTVGMEVLSIIILIMMIGRDKGALSAWFAKNALFLVFLVSFGAMAFSLFYSEVIGFAPCMLCWYQRIFIYPTAIITLVALIKKNSGDVLNYALVLSIIGGLIALWHNIERFVGKELVSCGANNPSCLQQLVSKFGYIDIPVMSLTAFVFIILLVANQRRFRN